MQKNKLISFLLVAGTLGLTSCGPQQHVHEYGELHPQVDSTCQSAGTEAYYLCECGQYFDIDHAEIEGPVSIAIKSHSYSAPSYTWNGRTVTARANCTNEGCTEVISETKTGTYVEDTAANCENASKGHLEATFENTILGSTSTEANSTEDGSALGHSYGNVSVSWNGDSATASTSCTRPGCENTVTETKTGTYVKDTSATCEENEKGHYEVTFDNTLLGSSATEANSKEVADSKLGHDYGNVLVTWEGANATATKTCGNDGSHVVTETKAGTYVEDSAADCENASKGHYEVTFNNTLLGSARTAANSATQGNPLGHDYGVVSVSWEGTSATATKTCSHNGAHVITETKAGTFVEDTAATCLGAQTGHYEVTFNNSELGSASTEANSVTGNSATGHDYGEASVSWEGANATSTRTCANDASHVLTETKAGTYVEDTAANCENASKGHYEVTFSETLLGSASTAANSVTNGSALGHSYGELKNAVDPTCIDNGNSAYYECSECHKLFNTEHQVIESASVDAKGHTMVNGQCVDCSAFEMDWNASLYAPQNLVLTEESAPAGYSNVYKYDADCGGGTTNCFFSHGSQLNDVVEFRYSILTDNANVFNLRPQTDEANIAKRIPLPLSGSCFVEIVFTRENTSSNSWNVKFNTPGNMHPASATDATYVIKNSGLANSLWGVSCITNQGNGGYAPIYITEVIARTSSYHVHNYGSLVEGGEATCEQAGSVAHYECETCHTLLDENRQPISSYVTDKLAHNFNASGYCADCGAYKMNYNDVRASSSVTYTANNEAEKAPGFAEVYDVVSGGAPTSGDWAFFKSGESFAMYKKLTFATKVASNDEMGINITGAAAGYYHIANHNGAWVNINLVNDNGAWVVTVENAQLIKHGTSNVVASVVLGGATFHDLGLRKNDGNINTAMMTEVVVTWNTEGNHTHNLDGNNYCSACGKYVLSYEAGAYAGSSLLSHPDYISKAGFTGPENSGDFYYYNTLTGGALNSTTFFAHANLGIGYDRAINGQQWASFSFYILSTNANNARIVVPEISGKQSASHLAIPRGCTKVEAKLESVDGTLYYGLYFNGSNTASGYVKRAGWATLGQNFQILSETGFYITEISYAMEAVK